MHRLFAHSLSMSCQRETIGTTTNKCYVVISGIHPGLHPIERLKPVLELIFSSDTLYGL